MCFAHAALKTAGSTIHVNPPQAHDFLGEVAPTARNNVRPRRWIGSVQMQNGIKDVEVRLLTLLGFVWNGRYCVGPGRWRNHRSRCRSHSNVAINMLFAGTVQSLNKRRLYKLEFVCQFLVGHIPQPKECGRSWKNWLELAIPSGLRIQGNNCFNTSGLHAAYLHRSTLVNSEMQSKSCQEWEFV